MFREMDTALLRGPEKELRASAGHSQARKCVHSVEFTNNGADRETAPSGAHYQHSA